MKKIHLLIAIIVFSGIAVFSVASSIGNGSVWNQNANINKTISKIGCSELAGRDTLLSSAAQSKIRLLGEFEAQCESQVTNNITYSIELVSEEKNIPAWAARVSSDLKEFQELGLTPVLMVKTPFTITTNTASASARTTIASSDVQTKMWGKMFDELYKNGTSQSMLQNWILFPEPNVPKYDTQALSPKDFTTAVNAATPVISNRVTNAQVGLLMNAMTFEQKGFSWGEKEYVSWMPYLENITPRSVNSIGVVAFPWMPIAGSNQPSVIDPQEYIPTWLIDEAAEQLAVKKVRLYTGTFASLYAQDPKQQILVPAEIRKEWLSKSLEVVSSWSRNGLEPMVIVTTQDPRLDATASEWGYWGSESTNNSDHKWAILEFIVALNQQDIPLELSL